MQGSRFSGFDPSSISPEAAQAAGESIYSQAENAVGGLGSAASGSNYAGIANAAQAIASEIPSGNVGDFVKAAVDVVEGAASGAAAGASMAAVLPPPLDFATPLAAEVGAVIGGGIQVIRNILPLVEKDHWNPIKIIGDVIGSIVNIFDPSKPPQGDFRYLSEKLCFPEVSDGPLGLIPGSERYNPRMNPQSFFYQTPSGPNQAWSLAYTFLVGWNSPPQSTPVSRAAAWRLAQQYSQSFALRLGHKFQGLAISPEDFRRVARVAKLYGQPNLFPAGVPYATSQGKPVNPQNTAAFAESTLKQFSTHPLDSLYYPIPVHWDSGSQQLQPTSKANQTSVMLCADTTLFIVCEAVVLGLSDASVFHLMVKEQNAWVYGRKKDAKVYKGLPVSYHPNFSRVMGYAARAMGHAPKVNASGPNGSATNAVKGNSTRTKSGGVFFPVVGGTLGLGVALHLWSIAKRKRQSR